MNYFSISAEASNVHKKSVSGTHSEALAVSESRRAHLLLRDKRAQRAIVYYSTGSLAQWVACGNLCLFLSISLAGSDSANTFQYYVSARSRINIQSHCATRLANWHTARCGHQKEENSLFQRLFVSITQKVQGAWTRLSLFCRGIPVFYAWPHSVNTFWSRGLALKLNYAKPLIISFFLDIFYKDIILPSGWILMKRQALFKYKLWTQKIAQHSK